MLRAIMGDDLEGDADLIREIGAFRHRHFVEGLGWETLRRPDGIERDAFDTGQATHLVFIEDGAVRGYSRLLPTTGPHLLSHVYPELMGGKVWPTGVGIFEWTRCAADEGVSPVSRRNLSHLLMTAVLEYFQAIGIASLIVETTPKLVEMLRWTGYQVHPLSAPLVYKGETLLAIEAVPSERALARHRAVYGIDRSLLSPRASASVVASQMRPLPLSGSCEHGACIP